MSDKYEGLNLPQLMDLLHELSVPDPAPMTPQTSGWVVVLIWLLFIALFFVIEAYRKWKKNGYRREALRELSEIQSRSNNSGETAAGISTLLKRTALAAYPRTEVAKLHGATWAEFLRRSTNHDPIVAQGAEALASAAYQKRVSAEPLYGPAKRWIEKHHA